MKQILFAALLWLTTFLFPQVGFADPVDDIRAVISKTKIWFVADETPLTNLLVQVKNECGKVVLEKRFTAKSGDWTLDVSQLPAGNYHLEYEGGKPTTFRK